MITEIKSVHKKHTNGFSILLIDFFALNQVLSLKSYNFPLQFKD